MATQSHYDSYPLPDGGVDLEEYEDADTATSLLLAYNASGEVLRLAKLYLQSVVAETAVESPLVYSHLGRVRAGWHVAPGGGFQSAEFRFAGYDMRWHVDRKDSNAMATAVFVRNYHDTRPQLPAVAEGEEKTGSPPRRGFMHESALPPVKWIEAKGPARTPAPLPPPALVLECHMRIADLLLNTHEPGFILAAANCAACGRMVAVHDQ